MHVQNSVLFTTFGSFSTVPELISAPILVVETKLVVKRVLNTRPLIYFHKEKARGFRYGDRSDHATGSTLSIQLLLSFLLNAWCIKRVKWSGAPFCLKLTFWCYAQSLGKKSSIALFMTLYYYSHFHQNKDRQYFFTYGTPDQTWFCFLLQFLSFLMTFAFPALVLLSVHLLDNEKMHWSGKMPSPINFQGQLFWKTIVSKLNRSCYVLIAWLNTSWQLKRRETQ